MAFDSSSTPWTTSLATCMASTPRLRSSSIFCEMEACRWPGETTPSAPQTGANRTCATYSKSLQGISTNWSFFGRSIMAEHEVATTDAEIDRALQTAKLLRNEPL